MAITLATDDGRALFELTPVLDDTRYRVRVWWNDRGLYWTISVALGDGSTLAESTRIFDGRAIRVNENMFGQWIDDNLPGGALIAIDTSGADLDPDRDAWANGRCKLIYVTAAELAAL